MIIDAHTHAYPDKDLALVQERTALLDQSLPDSDPHKWMLHHEGSVQALLEEERSAGIDRLVLLPVSSRPERTRSLNQWVAEMAATYPRIIPFGTLLAGSPSLTEELEELLDLGLRGIKVHPFLQRLDILSRRARRLWGLLEGAGLPVMLDSMYLKGLEHYKPHLKQLARMAGAFETGPDRIAVLAKDYPELIIIAPHLGSLYAWERLDPLYPLENVFFDLSFMCYLLPSEQVVDIVHRKGSDHVLFGTDAPWRRPSEARIWFDGLPLNPMEFEQISHQNFEGILARGTARTPQSP
jgi:predicted TIM-barrel fold metal-dependent hydrolase